MAEIAREPLDETQLVAILQREYHAADHYRQELDQTRALTNDYYDGRPFGNEMDGMSQVVLPDVQEVVDYMTASVLRTFASGERVVEFEAPDEGNEVAAEEATEAVNYTFLRLQDGYRLLHDVGKDGLLNKIGVFKTVVETEEYVSREEVIADPLQLGMLPEGTEIEDIAENEDGTVTASLKHQRIKKVFRDYAIPPWCFLFSSNARHEDKADYLCHEEIKTRSDLVEMGFDPEQVYALPAHSRHSENFDPRSEEQDWQDAESSAALEQVLLCEEYVRLDVDGDGIAERVRVFRVEGEILRRMDGPPVETVDDHPFAVFCPFPRQHRLCGDSLAEKVMDIQLVRSEVARQLLNGMAFDNMPRLVVDTGTGSGVNTETLDDILSPIPGAPIRVKGGVAAVQPLAHSFNAAQSLSVMEWITGERESRTGITRLNQGLDADALNKTATGTAMMQAAGQQQEEFIARNLAECLARLFVKKYKLMRAEAEPFSIRVDGNPKVVDPSRWPEDINIVVRTGLGSGSKDRRVQARMALAPMIQEAIGAGLAGQEHAFNLIDGLSRDMGIGKGDDYLYSPDSPEMQANAQQPDPEVQAKMAEVEAKREEANGKLQLEGMKAQANAEIDREKVAASIETEREKHAMQMQVMREKAALEAELARDRAAAEIQLARERAAAEIELSRERNRQDAELRKNRPGGSLAE